MECAGSFFTNEPLSARMAIHCSAPALRSDVGLFRRSHYSQLTYVRHQFFNYPKAANASVRTFGP